MAHMRYLAPVSLCFAFALCACHAGGGSDDLGGPRHDLAGTAGCGGACPSGQVCSGGSCVAVPQSCPCPKETYCDVVGDTCKVGCLADDECDTGRICITATRVCQAGCRMDTACGAGQICTNLTCQAGCRADTGCPAGQLCDTTKDTCYQGGRVVFAMPVPYDAGTGMAPYLRLGDVNHDGHLDIVAGDRLGMDLGVLLGKGDGTFTKVPLQQVGAYDDFAVVDVNGDGSADLLLLDMMGGQLKVYLSSGDGTFKSKSSYPSRVADPRELLAVDLNGDGKSDMAVSYPITGQVGYLLGVGDGTFVAETDVKLCAASAQDLLVGDVNGDGKKDLVLGCDASTIGVAYGKSGGTFGAPTTLSVFYGANYLWDLNGDGKGDLIGLLPGSSIGVMINGGGGFASAVSYGVGPGPDGVAAADVDGDKITDLLVSNDESASMSVLIGKGDGTFLPASTVAVGEGPQDIVSGDFNGDGKPDVALPLVNNVAVVLNRSP